MVSSKVFSWYPSEKKLVAEISDLGKRPFEQIYEDACDLGITVVSDKTGEAVKFAVESEVYDREGDLQYMVLSAIPKEVRKNRKLEGVTIVLFND